MASPCGVSAITPLPRSSVRRRLVARVVLRHPKLLVTTSPFGQSALVGARGARHERVSGTGCQADPVHGGITVRGFTADEWELLRTLRLAALIESPAAFASTRKEEAELPEHVWRQRASRLAVAFCDGQPVGLVGVIESEGQTP